MNLYNSNISSWIKRSSLLFACLLLPLFSAGQSGSGKAPPLIPAPQVIECESNNIVIKDYWIDPVMELTDGLRQLKKMLKEKGLHEAVDRSKADFTLSVLKEAVQNPYGFEGAYQLDTGKHTQILAETQAGLYYAVQTMRQLITQQDEKVVLAGCSIEDWPAFKYRGYMVDLGRNYQSVEQLKEQIRVMANYKMNRLHLHLTDDPGWRLQSKKYPKLQSAEA